MTKLGKVVFTGTASWWEIVTDRSEIVCESDTFTGEWRAAAEVAEIDVDDTESWVAVVTDAVNRHPAVKVGDYACCGGPGCDVIFVRLA